MIDLGDLLRKNEDLEDFNQDEQDCGENQDGKLITLHY